jgi:hypothetical protein
MLLEECRVEPCAEGSEPNLCSTLSLAFSLKPYLSTGHQSFKPDMISQLEREEKLWMKEIQTQAGRRSGETAAGVRGSSPVTLLGNLLSRQPKGPSERQSFPSLSLSKMQPSDGVFKAVQDLLLPLALPSYVFLLSLPFSSVSAR